MLSELFTETCGNGVVDTGEECDDGNDVDTDSCRNRCLSAICGDGVVSDDEGCDDGNNVTERCAYGEPIAGFVRPIVLNRAARHRPVVMALLTVRRVKAVMMAM